MIFIVKGIDAIILYSTDAKKLADFYSRTVGLKQTITAEMGDKPDMLYGFEFESGTTLYIQDHSELTGPTQESKRVMVNYEVDNIESEFDRLVKAGVTKVADVYHIEEYGYVATFADPDGNYFQLVQVRP